MTDVLSPFFIRVGKRFLNPEQQPSVMRKISIQFDDTKAIKLKNGLLNGHYLEASPAFLIQKNSEAIEVVH